MIGLVLAMVRVRRAQAVTLALLALFAVAAAVAAPAYLDAVDQAVAVGQVATAAPGERRIVISSTVDDSNNDVGASTTTSFTEVGAALIDMPGFAQVYASEYATIGIDPDRHYRSRLTYRQNVCAHLEMVTGRCLAGEGETVLGERTAARLHLRAGDPIELQFAVFSKLPTNPVFEPAGQLKRFVVAGDLPGAAPGRAVLGHPRLLHPRSRRAVRRTAVHQCGHHAGDGPRPDPDVDRRQRGARHARRRPGRRRPCRADRPAGTHPQPRHGDPHHHRRAGPAGPHRRRTCRRPAHRPGRGRTADPGGLLRDLPGRRVRHRRPSPRAGRRGTARWPLVDPLVAGDRREPGGHRRRCTGRLRRRSGAGHRPRGVAVPRVGVRAVRVRHPAVRTPGRRCRHRRRAPRPATPARQPGHRPVAPGAGDPCRVAPARGGGCRRPARRGRRRAAHALRRLAERHRAARTGPADARARRGRRARCSRWSAGTPAGPCAGAGSA